MEKARILKALRIQSLFSISVYVFVYLVRVFVCWEFMNPFDWVLDMPIYSRDDRALILLLLLIYYGLSFGLIYDLKTKKDNGKEK